jgi:hypothetical protein
MAITAIGQYINQLAQSFTVGEVDGIFVTKIGVFFADVSATFPITLHLKPMTTARRPSIRVLASVTKNGGTITTSAAGTTETTFTFEEPVYLSPGEYAFSLESADLNEYKVWASQLGEYKLGTTQERVTKDLSPGFLFATSAGSAQRRNEDQDIKFKIYRAEYSASGTAVFRDANPPVRLLGTNPFYAKAVDLNVHVVHPNHGFSVNDRVNIQGVSGTVNGITAARLNKQHTITGVDGTGYKFALAAGANQTAANTPYGGAAVTATQQYKYDVAQLQIGEVIPNSTTIKYTGALTTSNSFAGSETAYASTTGVKLINGENVNLGAPHLIAYDSNEVTFLSSGQSSTITATLTASKTPGADGLAQRTSPIIDLQRATMLTIGNRIDRPASSTASGFNVPLTYVAETDPSAGSALAKHITKPVTLASGATGLKILFAGHRPSTSHFDVYFRTVVSGNDSDILEKSFVQATVDAQMPNDVSENEFHEYRFTVGGDFASTLQEFDRYQVKIAMYSTSTSDIPRIRDLRTIALN